MAEQLPRPLIKAYKRLEHARNFIEHGEIHLGSLSYYKEIEDKRRQDKDEGEGRLIVPGVNETPVNYGTSTTHPLYAFCLFSPDVEPLVIEGYGQYRVKITDPEAFLQDLEESVVDLCRGAYDREATIDFCPVRYDKDCKGNVREGSFDMESWRLKYAQKLPKFSHEEEVRAVVMLSGGMLEAPESLYINLRRFSDYVEPGYPDSKIGHLVRLVRKGNALERELEMTCCFCHETIEEEDGDPCGIALTANYTKSVEEQVTEGLFCHLRCFEEKIHKSSISYLRDLIEGG